MDVDHIAQTRIDFVDLTQDIPSPAVVDEQSRLLQNINKALTYDAGREVFAVGGTIHPDKHHPIDIRFDRAGETICKATLPLTGNQDQELAFGALLQACKPATFGKGKVDVLDETYRKAGALDERLFSTSFNLAQYDILETVTQVLVQGKWHGGVTAVLYKLNVYSGPGGKFKSHVDTPRGQDQIGSLVVCLPCEHKGGALAVRHDGKEVLFDWAPKSQQSIQWAALFSDCEHEVLEVTAGHRITLTYNLYLVAGGPAGMATQLQALDQDKLHFFAELKKLMECPTFLPSGGDLGFSCTHVYPHTSESHISDTDNRLGCMMKGLDMAVFQSFSRFSKNVHCEAVLSRDDESEDYYDDSDPENTTKSVKVDDQDNILSAFACVSEGGPPGVQDDPNIHEDSYPPESWLSYLKKKVTWLNHEPGNFNEVAAAWLAYGNQAELRLYYSAAVIIARIVPFKERMAALQVPKPMSIERRKFLVVEDEMLC